MHMPYDIYASRICKFCGQDRPTDRFGYYGKCWSQLEKIESDGEIFIQVPGKDNEKLLSHLQQMFKLESIDRYDIKKEDAGEYPTITVNITSASTIMIKVDKKTNKSYLCRYANNSCADVSKCLFV